MSITDAVPGVDAVVDASHRYFVDSTEADQGVATATGDKTIKDHVDAIGTSKKATLYFLHDFDADTTTYTLTTNETIPSNITLAIENGVVFAGTGTLTVEGFVTLDIGNAYNANSVISYSNTTLDFQQLSAGVTGLKVLLATDVEATASGIQVKGYSPSLELMDKDGVQNWYMGIDDNESNRLQIGIGYGPSQAGIDPSITITIDGTVLVGDETNPGATFAVASSPSGVGGGDSLAWFRHEGDAANNEALIRHEHFSNDQVPQPIYTGIANRGTIASPLTLQNGDILLILDGRGYDGTDISDTAAQVALKASQTWTNAAHGAYLTFSVTADDSTSPAEAVQITPNKLRVDGALSMLEKSADPTGPAEGECVIWMSDGTGKGDDGDIMIASQAGGTTNYGTLFDHSAGAAW